MNQITEFIITKEYKRFVEFCNACKKEIYIELCYGPAGVGKSMAAYHLAQWEQVHAQIKIATHHPTGVVYSRPTIKMNPYNTLVYTPELLNSPKSIKEDIDNLTRVFNHLKERSIYGESIPLDEEIRLKSYVELLIIDEADRLQSKSLEQIRDYYDRYRIPIIFIGMPGIEKRLIRFPQLYSRIGFAHAYQSLSKEEIAFIIKNHLHTLGILIEASDFTDQEAIAAITRITQGNFRLINRLLKQAIRIMKVNQLSNISKEVIEAARECLVIGNIY